MNNGFQREVREGLEEGERPAFAPELMRRSDVPAAVDDLSRQVIGCSLEARRLLGAGMVESVYETALDFELSRRGIPFVRQAEITIPYKSIQIRGQRLDLLVADLIIVELKAVQSIAEVHSAQLLSYLRAADKPLGLLINFNVPLLRDGIRRIFNERWSGLRQRAGFINHQRSPRPVPASSSSRPSR